MDDERLTKVPADLDLKPYRDEHDTDLLERMAKDVEKGVQPAGVDKPGLHARIKSQLKTMLAHSHSHEPQGSMAAKTKSVVKKASGSKTK
jgi:hypothetical protein